ncbi:hypothetical protein GLW07_18965 [Bacillus hwajinpoensis]|uniref:Uncharacterized protein n=1 Tax=Guptibacillus hwajinpoensis TaxID=208199 RepID=A0A845F3X5_9BACL|nr:hypothetical protein [Pseudalkalibacillus hwajinpoensis]MYL65444.1 hypothetical protein [Pseudalkalibacillus hwajinpoensis]
MNIKEKKRLSGELQKASELLKMVQNNPEAEAFREEALKIVTSRLADLSADLKDLEVTHVYTGSHLH